MPIRVLQVVTIMNRGGEETMIMNYYRHMNTNEIQFDFLVHRDEIGDYEAEILQMGGRIFRAFSIRPWNYNRYQKWLKSFFEWHKGEFAAVHAHILENCGFVLKEARMAGVSIRIAHSHSAQTHFDYKFLFRNYGKYVLKNCQPTHRLACGADAGRYLFDGLSNTVLPNAVDTEKFVYNEVVREKVRAELHITDEIVIGNVARFHPVKNQTFLVDIFYEYLKLHPKSKLMLVGIGDELEKVRKKAIENGLREKVIFMGLRTDVDRILQAIDMIVFPSKLEGLPLSLVEAQAAGLPCLLSDHVAVETAITDLVQFEKLDSSPKKWAKRIEEMLLDFRRTDYREQIKAAGYDIQTNAKYLSEIYLCQEL